MKIITDLLILIHGNISNQLRNKGEDRVTAKMLALMQLTTMVFLNFVSLSLVIFSLMEVEIDFITNTPAYYKYLVGVCFFAAVAYILHYYLSAVGPIESRYNKLVDLPQFKKTRVAATLIPYLTMAILVISMILTINWSS